MASTYSPLLRLELIGTGDQTGTWGNTTNTNLGTLLDQAVAGTAPVDVTIGDVTLSTLNGAADQSRCAILRFVGTPSAARNVIAPASSKWYLVSNECGQTVTVKTADTAGYEVINGATLLLFYNGTDIVPGSSSALGYIPVNKAGDTMTGALYLPAEAPTVATQAANKQYVDNAVSGAVGGNFVLKAGDTMTGPLTLSGNPTTTLQAAPKQYVDNAISSAGFATQAWVTSQSYATTSTQSLQYYYTKTDSDSRFVSVSTTNLQYYTLTSQLATYISTLGYPTTSGTNSWNGTNTFNQVTYFGPVTGGLPLRVNGGSGYTMSVGGGSFTTNSTSMSWYVNSAAQPQISLTTTAFYGIIPFSIDGKSSASWFYCTGEGQLGLQYSPTGSYGWHIGEAVGHEFIIYTNTPGSTGGVYMSYNTNTWQTRSDRRIKTDLEIIPNALEKMDKINGYTGRMIDDETNTRHPYLIAQEIQEVLPEAISHSCRRDSDGDGIPDDLLGLGYTDVIPLLVQAIKELKAEVYALKAAK